MTLQWPLKNIFSQLSPSAMGENINAVQARYFKKHFAKPSVGPLVHVALLVGCTGYYFHNKHFRK